MTKIGVFEVNIDQVKTDKKIKTTGTFGSIPKNSTDVQNAIRVISVQNLYVRRDPY